MTLLRLRAAKVTAAPTIIVISAHTVISATLDNSADDGSTGGRGLQLVDRLATAWGCQPGADGQGKVVWFRLTI